MTAPRRFRPLVVLVAAASLLAACGTSDGDDDPAMRSAATEDGEGGDQAAPNRADVDFTRAMIVHHEQALEMASLAEDRADAEEVRALATRIGAAQQPEIDRMQQWLEAWGEDAPEGGDGLEHGGMDMGGGGSMGMMSSEDMGRLEEASGAEFDRMFLEMMIEHHRGAIAMAREVQVDGSHPDVLALAADVVSDQEAEVDEMEQLLEDLGSGAG